MVMTFTVLIFAADFGDGTLALEPLQDRRRLNVAKFPSEMFFLCSKILT
jgi:hypothetical protein